MRVKPLLPRKVYLQRLLRSACLGLGIIIGSLLIGMVGYHHLEKMSWVDSFVNAAMILGGMGPVGQIQTDAGKIFAGFYALYCGIALISILGIVFAPVIRRFLHKYHLEFLNDGDDDDGEKKPKKGKR
jgi:hypothetical protein